LLSDDDFFDELESESDELELSDELPFEGLLFARFDPDP
jgi:hypothetical protein